MEETAEVVAKNWQDLKKTLKPLLKQIKEERQKEEEQTVFIDGIEYLINQVMMAKDSSTKKEVKANNPPSVSSPSAARVTKLTKPAKVPTWTRDLMLEVYVKQPHTCQVCQVPASNGVLEYKQGSERIAKICW